MVNMLNRRKVDVARPQKVRHKNHGTRIIKGDERIYKLFRSGNPSPNGGS